MPHLTCVQDPEYKVHAWQPFPRQPLLQCGRPSAQLFGESVYSTELYPFKGHAVQDHLCASRDVLHGEDVHAHAKSVQQLRPELALLQDSMSFQMNDMRRLIDVLACKPCRLAQMNCGACCCKVKAGCVRAESDNSSKAGCCAGYALALTWWHCHDRDTSEHTACCELM